MKNYFILLMFCFSFAASAQKVTVGGHASDTSNGTNVIEIVINDTLSKIMKDPKAGRPKYMRLYQDSRVVVRTNPEGRFAIKAQPTDSLYFKSYGHITESYLVSDLMRRETIKIVLKPDGIIRD